MKSNPKGPLADSIDLYLAHKRSLGKQLAKVGPMLHLLDRYLLARGVAELRQVTPTQIDEFVASSPRHPPRSYATTGARGRGTCGEMPPSVRYRLFALPRGRVKSPGHECAPGDFPLR